MNKFTSLLAGLAGALIAVPLHAQQGGGYFGVGALSSITDNARDFALAADGSGADRSASGFKAYGGYLSQNGVGIEGGYYDLGRYEVSIDGTKSDDFSISAFAVSGVIAAPLGSAFLFSGKLGLAFTTVQYRCFQLCDVNLIDTKVTDVAALLGAGLGWRVSRNFSLRADFEYLSDVTHAVGLIEENFPYRVFSLSGQFNF